MTSLRYKFVIALLATSMVSSVFVIGVAYARLVNKFDDMALQSALQSFRNDVSAYFNTYGSWEEAQQHEDFPSFSERRRQKLGLPLVEGLNPVLQLAGDRDIKIEPLIHEIHLPKENLHTPPFRFYLFDAQWRALLPLEPYRVGELIRAGQHKKILPIELKGQIVAYFSPEGHIYYSDFDLGYLSAIREAFLYGTAVSILLTLVLGLALGHQLSATLRRLTVAIQAMEKGHLKQKVVVNSHDEVGVLAHAFNRMSDELARNHEELRQAHEQVRQQAEQLRELSICDDLTQLHNRRFFGEQAQALFNQAARYQRPFTVMIGDIDFFKHVNDEFSHAMGDEVLRRISGILRSHVRTVDIVARYGGEEFVIAFPETPLHRAVGVCEKLRQHIEQYQWYELHPTLKVTMSMGLCGNIGAESLDAMLAKADFLLYQAKLSGRNRLGFEAE